MSNASIPTYSQFKALGQRILSRLTSLESNKYILTSSTEGSTKKFKLMVDDDGRLITEEIA